MHNYQRYELKSKINFFENFISNILWRIPSDRKILPIIKQIKGKNVCDVGCGTGAYSKVFIKNGNNVLGIDKNPALCGVNIRVLNIDAAVYSEVFNNNEKFDVIFSGWLTEYLDESGLRGFISSSYKMLDSGGFFIFTVIKDKGWGKVYINLAKKIRNIDKFFYNDKSMIKLLHSEGFTDVVKKDLNSWFFVPWAELYICKKD